MLDLSQKRVEHACALQIPETMIHIILKSAEEIETKAVNCGGDYGEASGTMDWGFI
jgi:hypothetical protein